MNKRKEKYQNNIQLQFFVSFWLLYNIYLQINSFYQVLLFFLADLFTGLIHIFLDNKLVLDVSTTLNRLAYAFQYKHHKKPKDFIENVLITATHGQFEILLYLSTPVFLSTYYFMKNNNLIVLMYTINVLSTNSQVIHGLSHCNISQLPSWI